LVYEPAAKFIQDEFVGLNRDTTKKQVYPHITCATDTGNIKVVFQATKEIIINQSLEESGFK